MARKQKKRSTVTHGQWVKSFLKNNCEHRMVMMELNITRPQSLSFYSKAKSKYSGFPKARDLMRRSEPIDVVGLQKLVDQYNFEHGL